MSFVSSPAYDSERFDLEVDRLVAQFLQGLEDLLAVQLGAADLAPLAALAASLRAHLLDDVGGRLLGAVVPRVEQDRDLHVLVLHASLMVE